MCRLGFTLTELLDESDSMNKNLRSRGIGLSDECVYDQKIHRLYLGSWLIDLLLPRVQISRQIFEKSLLGDRRGQLIRAQAVGEEDAEKLDPDDRSFRQRSGKGC